jgi:hypothetical protein
MQTVGHSLSLFDGRRAPVLLVLWRRYRLEQFHDLKLLISVIPAQGGMTEDQIQVWTIHSDALIPLEPSQSNNVGMLRKQRPFRFAGLNGSLVV